MIIQRPTAWDEIAALVTLRDAAPEDAERLAALHVRCWTETYSGLVDPQILAGLNVGNRTASWLRQIETLPETGRILLLEAGRHLIGFGATGAQRSGPLAKQGYDGEIAALYLLADWQGLGLGKRLFDAQIASLIERGFRNASLWVLTDNHKARRFYERRGGRALSLSQAVPSLGGPSEIAYGWREPLIRSASTIITPLVA